jgi:hypothetical protein
MVDGENLCPFHRLVKAMSSTGPPRSSGGEECLVRGRYADIFFFKIFFEMNMSVSWYCMLGLFVPDPLTSFCSCSRNKRHIYEKEDEEIKMPGSAHVTTTSHQTNITTL